MGLPQYRRQLYVRPRYLQLRAILAQLVQVASQHADKLRIQSVRLVVNLVLANHSVLCTQPPTSLLKALGL